MTAQRSSLDPCLVMCPRATLTSDSRCRGVSPAQEQQLPRVAEPGHLADLGDDDRGEDRADTGSCWITW